MSITSTVDRDLVINVTENDDTLNDIATFAFDPDHSDWGQRPSLWDLTHFNFPIITSEEVRSFVLKMAPLTDRRTGLKTAVVAPSDAGFAIMRMLQQIADGRFRLDFEVFRSKDRAIEWLLQPATLPTR